MPLLEFKVEAAAIGTHVYVRLGHLTVKSGKVAGHRITIISEQPAVEYLVHWFGPGDRPEAQEWFSSRCVHQDCISAFGI